MIGFLKKIYRGMLAKFVSSKLYVILLGVFSSSGRLASFWFLLTGSFSREHRAVLHGRYQHLIELNERLKSGAVYTLRRNTHRLEKGLIMRPRRKIFALDYIHETAEVYKGVVEQGADKNQDLIIWARDVLDEYFSVVDSHKVIDQARTIFESVHVDKKEPEKFKKPYVRDLDTPINISIEDLEKLAIRRRSCRLFLQKPVPRDMIDKALKVAAYSPSACNRQPFEFRFFDEGDLPAKVGGIPMGTRGFSDNFPCVAVIVGKLHAFPYDRDRHVSYIDSSLAAMAFQFGLEVQGISSCCINWPDIKDREQAVTKALNLAPDERVIMMMAIGYPDKTAMVPYSQKKPLDDLRSFNRLC